MLSTTSRPKSLAARASAQASRPRRDRLGNRSQNVDELAVAVAMAGQPDAGFAPVPRQVQLRNGSPLRSAPGFLANTGR